MTTILVTGVGAPGTAGTFTMLHKNPDNESVRIIGTDMRDDVIGKCWADKFYQIPPCDSPHYIPELFGICGAEKVDLIIPQNTMELHKLASYKWSGMNFMLEHANKIFVANNKYSMIKIAESLGVSTPSTVQFRYDRKKDAGENMTEFFSLANKLGYGPDNSPIVVKPEVGHGSRGVKVLYPHIDYTERWKMKPDSLHMAAEDFLSWLDFMPSTDMLIQEYLPGDEYTVDVMINGDEAMAVPRRRDEIKSGITSIGTVVQHDELSEYCIRLSRKLGFKYPHGYQFKEDAEGTPRLLECNPRVQGTMIATNYAGWNIVWDGVRRAMGQEVKLGDVMSNLKWNTRVLRYTDTIKIE
jgi:carbamoyl-phosphate synthase large subunit